MKKAIYGRILPLAVVGIAISGCGLGDRVASLDFDLRGTAGGLDTSDAARNAVADRPQPDDRGVISYPNYQVAVARRGDTVTEIATRVGANPGDIAELNGLQVNDRFSGNEIVALPASLAAPIATPGTQSADVSQIATSAIGRAPDTPGIEPTEPSRRIDGPEPVRHQVELGETAFSVARLYKVTPRALADWNGLDADYTVREGQFLLIPIVQAAATAPAVPVPDDTTQPGVGTVTPVPPSAGTALPAPAAPAVAPPEPTPEPQAAPAPEPQEPAAAPSSSSGGPNLSAPVSGAVIKPWRKGQSEWIELAANAGASVNAAADGTVAIISKDTDEKTILVLRHANNFLTVYVNIADISVAKGDRVTRGQAVAKVADTKLHFELRRGLDSIDPTQYLK